MVHQEQGEPLFLSPPRWHNGAMRIKAAERRQLVQLLEFVRRGVPAEANVFGVAAALPWLLQWEATGHRHIVQELLRGSSDAVRQVLALARDLTESPNANAF